MANDNEDVDIEKLERQIKALEDKANNQQNASNAGRVELKY